MSFVAHHNQVDHIHVNGSTQDHVYDHNCDSCTEGFDSGHGVKIDDHKFCNACIDLFAHFEYYRKREVSDSNIYHLTNKMILL
jgi:hypothetical protein